MQRRAAFTLLELMLAIAMLSVIMVVTYNSVGHAVRVRDAVTSRGAAIRAAAAFFARLDRELAAAYVDPRKSASSGGVVPALADTVTLFRGTSYDDVVPRDALVFTCNCGEVWTFGLADSNRMPHTEIAYDFLYDAKLDATVLVRREDASMDNDPSYGGLEDAMWAQIRGLNLRYLDPVDKRWKDDWDSVASPQAPLPQAVEVTIWLAAMEADGEEVEAPLVLGRTIMLPQVAPGRIEQP